MLKSLVFGTLAALLVTVASPLRAQTGDIVDTAVAAGSFKTLAKALEAADLVATLKGPGPFTVFAPTDDAFAKLPAGTVENLLKPENKAKLVRLLTYHVVAGKVMAAQAAKMTSAKAVSGDMLTISAAGGDRDDRPGQGGEGRYRREQRRHSRHRQRHHAEGSLTQQRPSPAAGRRPLDRNAVVTPALSVAPAAHGAGSRATGFRPLNAESPATCRSP